MDYIRIKTQSRRATEPMANSQQLIVNDIKELLKDWIKLYPDSFAPDMEFMIYQLEDGDIIIKLHEDMSSLAVALLVLYLESLSHQVTKSLSRDAESQSRKDAEPTANSQQPTANGQQPTANSQRPTANSQQPTANSQQPTAFITIDDTEVLLKQNIGKRAMVFCESPSHRVTESPSRDTEPTANSQRPIANSQQPTAVRFLLEDSYVLDYDFERRPQPVRDSGLQFEEQEFTLPECCDIVRVGDVVKNKVDKVLEDEGLTPMKMLIYLLCGVIGLAIGFLIVYFTGK